jgi:hypothetical protein
MAVLEHRMEQLGRHDWLYVVLGIPMHGGLEKICRQVFGDAVRDERLWYVDAEFFILTTSTCCCCRL